MVNLDESLSLRTNGLHFDLSKPLPLKQPSANILKIQSDGKWASGIDLVLY